MCVSLNIELIWLVWTHMFRSNYWVVWAVSFFRCFHLQAIPSWNFARKNILVGTGTRRHLMVSLKNQWNISKDILWSAEMTSQVLTINRKFKNEFSMFTKTNVRLLWNGTTSCQCGSEQTLLAPIHMKNSGLISRL